MTTIYDCLLQLLSSARNKYELPAFLSVCVIEKKDVRYGEAPVRFKKADVIEIEKYEERFKDVLHAGYAWVDVQLAGFLDDRLVLLVNYPSGSTGVPPGMTKIELHGPALDINNSPMWDIRQLFMVE